MSSSTSSSEEKIVNRTNSLDTEKCIDNLDLPFDWAFEDFSSLKTNSEYSINNIEYNVINKEIDIDIDISIKKLDTLSKWHKVIEKIDIELEKNSFTPNQKISKKNISKSLRINDFVSKKENDNFSFP